MKKPSLILIFILFSVVNCLALSSGNHPAKSKHKAAGGRHYKSIVNKIPDSVYQSRLEALPFACKLFFNSKVRKSIELYTIRSKSTMARAIGLSELYFPIIDTIFKAYGLPLELKYIAVLESGLNPKAIGKGVAGMWQFTKGTGQKFGLAVNSQVDERRAIIESTVAVAQYIKMLSGMYDNWYLVLAAYNCGYGRLNAAIRSAGGSRDFKKIYPFLPSYTQHFVPTFIGIAYTFNYYREHDITPLPHSLPQAIDTVRISKPAHLQHVASLLNMDIKTLRSINTHCLRDVIPASEKRSFTLYIPSEKKANFLGLRDSVLYSRNYAVPQLPVAGEDVASAGNIRYKVRPGDTLYGIARRYKVLVAALQKWNGISGNKIKAGQVLTVSLGANAEKDKH